MQPEEYAYPNGGMTRKARVIVRTNEEYAPVASALIAPVAGQARMVRVGIPDTFSTIPACFRYRGTYVRGYVSVVDEALTFTPYERKARGNA